MTWKLQARLLCLGLAILAGSPHARAALSDNSFCEPDGIQASGAVYRICMPDPASWNGDLVVWAHGYVAVTEPIAIPEHQHCFRDRLCVPDFVNTLGFGFATTSYSENGLAVLPGVADVVDLVQIFAETHGQPRRVYLVGASEGGLVTALAVEQNPDLFDAGLAACGPIGDFTQTFRLLGDFRVLFDYYFPGLMPGTLDHVPEWVAHDWDSFWPQFIRPIAMDPANETKIRQILRVTRTPFVAGRPETIEAAVHDALWYNAFAINDANMKLGGQPFDNTNRTYRGSRDDQKLNASVQRVQASETALDMIKNHYQTSGDLQVPLVTMSTTTDFRHEVLYRQRVREAGSGPMHRVIRVKRIGHCNFSLVQVVAGFALMVHMGSNETLDDLDQVLTTRAQRRQFKRWAERLKIPRPRWSD